MTDKEMQSRLTHQLFIQLSEALITWIQENERDPDLKDFLGSIILNACSSILTYQLLKVHGFTDDKKLVRQWFDEYYIHVLKAVFREKFKPEEN
jgi:23S rRNA C2498 (ribose-2'-O)-methylase RlmM